MRNTRTPSEFETLMKSRGMQFSLEDSAGKPSDPKYLVSGYLPKLEIRLHLENEAIATFRVGLKLYPANPPNPYTVNPADTAALQSLDNRLLFMYGKPQNARNLNLWNKYIDFYGNVYIDEYGVVKGLRTDDVHIQPSP